MGLFAPGLCGVKCMGSVGLGVSYLLQQNNNCHCLIFWPSFQFQKFLTLSCPLLERENPTLEQPKALRPLSSSSNVSVVGKVSS